MTLCSICNKYIPKERLQKWRTKKNRYCSEQCIKRSYYLRNTKAKNIVILEGASTDSCTAKGLLWEVYAQKILGGKLVSMQTMNQPFDILMENGMKVDVKSCNLYKRKMKRGKPVDQNKNVGWWIFNRNSQKDIDFFFCIGLIDNKPVKCFLVPSGSFTNHGVCISPRSKKWEAFEIQPFTNASSTTPRFA